MDEKTTNSFIQKLSYSGSVSTSFHSFYMNPGRSEFLRESGYEIVLLSAYKKSNRIILKGFKINSDSIIRAKHGCLTMSQSKNCKIQLLIYKIYFNSGLITSELNQIFSVLSSSIIPKVQFYRNYL